MTVESLPLTRVRETTVDVVVVGSGTGLAAALAAQDAGLEALVIEKTEYVGGSTSLSGGAFWIPANPILEAEGAHDTLERASRYIESLVDGAVPEERWRSFLDHGEATVELLRRATPLKFSWAREYADYHPERPGGSASGRSCESRPFNVKRLGAERDRLRPSGMAAPIPMPITGADYRWMNLMVRTPRRSRRSPRG
ncbi:FAD-binding protein [Naumannella halotolerans]|uniref:FAD binding domain-containing protein n=1 Tax=Naumannella halotolerans TaxID=993414 RepID=A0A4R7JAK1_9ACTN|nr:FAD-binding protein [Naumannella halotolerans]TDT33946.1 FAD binding domain-containing protein [Naumannella halotolerans]